VSNFEARVATLLKEHVHDGLGPRRPAPPLRDRQVAAPSPVRSSRWWLPLLAAACIVAVVAIALVVTGGSGERQRPVAPVLGTWERVRLPNGDYPGHVVEGVGFSDQQHGWVAGALVPQHRGPRQSVIWTTADGGRTWTLHTLPRPNGVTSFVAAFGDASHGWLAWIKVNDRTGGAATTVYATADGGTTWQDEGTFAGEARGIAAVDAQHAWIYGRNGFFYATTDGSNWTRLAAPGDGGTADFVDPMHGWFTASGRGGTYATSDGGQTWSRLPDPGGRRLGANLDFVSPLVGWASTPYSVLRTVDGGHTWHRVRHTRFYEEALAFSDGAHGWVFGDRFLGTADGGRTWVSHDVKGAILAAAAAGCSTVAVTSETLYRSARCAG
jgi:photosystem II stability/assembly factor-like uncharacterized protein